MSDFRGEDTGCFCFAEEAPQGGGIRSRSSSSSSSGSPLLLYSNSSLLNPAKVKSSSSAASSPPYPYDDVDDAHLAREMNELSVQEREQVLDDIHGVAATREETPEFIATCLQKLDTSLAALSYAKRKDLDRAFFLRPSLHNDRKFKLLFLRADNYNDSLAAERMAKYFTNKLSLFGEDKLVKDITLQDLDDNDKKILTSESNIILPKKDQAGRPIWFSDCSKADYEHMSSTIRAFWYDTMATVEDEAAQAKGVSCVLFCPGHGLRNNPPSISQVTALLLRIGSINACLPYRITSFHFGTDEPKMQFFLKAIQTGLGKQVRLRMRSHFGSAIEMSYSLLTFGIQCDFLHDTTTSTTTNMNTNTQPSKKNHQQQPSDIQREYIARRTEIETRQQEERLSTEQKTGIILYPLPNDVLLGRGRPNQEFSGNRRFADMIDSQVERFQNCKSQFEKTCVIMEAVKMVHDAGGRFLRRRSEDNSGWEVVSDKVAKKKAGGTFRTRSEIAAAAAAKDSSSSSTNNTTTTATATPVASLSTEVALDTASASPKANRATKRIKYDPSAVLS